MDARTIQFPDQDKTETLRLLVRDLSEMVMKMAWLHREALGTGDEADDLMLQRLSWSVPGFAQLGAGLSLPRGDDAAAVDPAEGVEVFPGLLGHRHQLVVGHGLGRQGVFLAGLGVGLAVVLPDPGHDRLGRVVGNPALVGGGSDGPAVLNQLPYPCSGSGGNGRSWNLHTVGYVSAGWSEVGRPWGRASYTYRTRPPSVHLPSKPQRSCPPRW
jgi:hypothetical protein